MPRIKCFIGTGLENRFKELITDVMPEIQQRQIGAELVLSEYNTLLQDFNNFKKEVRPDLAMNEQVPSKTGKVKDIISKYQLLINNAEQVVPEINSRSVPKFNDFSAGGFSIPDHAIVNISSENYRLQLNPMTDSYGDVANFTQLGYFINVLSKVNTAAASVNDTAATEIYDAFSKLISKGLEKVTSRLTKDGKVTKTQLKERLSGAGNERISELLEEVGYNMPNIANKALIQVMNMFEKETVKVTFKGGHLIMQTPYGTEMIGEESERYARLSEKQKADHDANWTRYGQEERKKLVDQSRNLKYGVDESGRLFAEVLIDKALAEKSKVGDFLLPDLMGYRIPSTELHSAVPLRVAGYYDSKGSNVIIAPAELVLQHGSDFDVDSLYVISREMWNTDISDLGIDLSKIVPVDFMWKDGMPVGYEWDTRSDKWIFNKKNWEDRFEKWYREAGTNIKLLKKVNKLYMMFQRNRIVESMLDVISNPVNLQRMTEPISVKPIKDVIAKLGLDSKKTYDLSNPLDNQEMFNSNMQGTEMIGIFANAMKVLAYMVKTGKSETAINEYPQLVDKVDTDKNLIPITVVGKQYTQFGEQTAKGEILWRILDALVNTSVDNVKNQDLYKINANPTTGGIYAAGKALGIPFEDLVILMMQPATLTFNQANTTRDRKLQAMKVKLLEVYNAQEDVKIPDYPSLIAKASTVKSASADSMKKYMNMKLDTLAPLAVLRQVKIAEDMERLYRLGENLITFSTAISVVQKFPVMYDDIQKVQDAWNKLGTVENGKFTTNSSFGFNVDNLFTSQPNIARAYESFQKAKATAEASFLKHSPEVRAFIDTVASESQVKLSFATNINKEMLKDELVNYLLSSLYSEENKTEKPITYTYKDKERIATGKQAWSQRFVERVVAEKKKLGDSNPFLNRLSSTTSYGLKNLIFAISSNSTYMDNLEMQEAFEMLEDEQMKKDFVKYAVMNYGLRFGVQNYSMFIPAQYLKPVDNYIQSLDRKLRSNTIEDGKIVKGELKNLKENFMLRLAVNHAEDLPYILGSKMKAIPSGKTFMANDGTMQPSLNGVENGYYYDKKYANPVEGDNRKFKQSDFPKFIKSGQLNTVLLRLNEPDSDFVYYQKVGLKNWTGGYDASVDALNENYDLDKYFGKDLVPVATGEILGETFDIFNDYVQEGSRVIIYGYSNESRDAGRFAVVESMIPESSGPEGVSTKRTITVKDIKEPQTQTQQEFRTRFEPIARMLYEKFKIPISLVTDEEMPFANKKGAIKDGRIYINIDKATLDTPFHEVSHVLIKAIQESNPEWFKALVKELHNDELGITSLETVKESYPELSEQDQEIEALVTLLGDLAGFSKPGTLITLLNRLKRAIRDILLSIMKAAGVINLDTLKAKELSAIRIEDLAEIMASKDADITLDLSGVLQKEDVFFSKAPGTSVMADILSQQDYITEPERDATGKEGNTYGIKENVEGPVINTVTRVSNFVKQFSLRKIDMKDKAGKVYADESEAFIAAKVEQKFKNIPTDGVYEEQGIQYTRDEYEESLKSFYKQGLIKGSLLHTLLQKRIALINKDTAVIPALESRIAELEKESIVAAGTYNWVQQKGIFDAIMENAGIVIKPEVPEALRDKVHSEVSVANTTMGTGGRIDTLIEKPDSRLKIVDYKTGNRFIDQESDRIMNYGSQEFDIFDNSVGQSKLQVMLYAVMIKASHPEARFEPPIVMHIPDEHNARSKRNVHQVAVRDYLEMIRQYYKNEKPEVYAQLLKESPDLFNPRHYGSSINTSFTQDLIDDKTGMRDDEKLRSYEAEFEQLVTGIHLRGILDNYKGGPSESELRKRDLLLSKITQARAAMAIPSGSTKDYEIGKFTQWLGTINDTSNPYIQAYSQAVATARVKVYEEFDDVEREFDNKLLKARESLGKRLGVERAFKTLDTRAIFENLIKEEIETTADGQRKVSRGLITAADPQWKTLTKEEQELLTFMQDKMENIFDEVLVTGHNAVVSVTKNGKKVTKLDVYNKNIGGGFKWHRSFIPKLQISSSEVRTAMLKKGLPGIKQYVKHELAKRLSMFYETHIEGDNQLQYGIPVKYLGAGSSIHNPDIHTSNLENVFKGFMQHMINKKHYDTVYALGDGMKGFLQIQQDVHGNNINENAADLLGFAITKNLIGRLNTAEDYTRKGLRLFVKDGKEVRFSPFKAARLLSSGVAASMLWLKIPGAVANGAQATWAVGKESMINSISSMEFMGIDMDKKDLSFANHTKAYGLVMGLQKDTTFGDGRANPVHVLMKTFRMYPDSAETMGIYNRRRITESGTAYNPSLLTVLYSFPEAMTTAVTAIDFMMTMKIQSGPYKGQSMWDVYSKSVVVDPVTGDGKFELPADFTRGKLRTGSGNLEELKGLHALEIQKLHYLVKRLKGGYRPEERSMVESTILGEQFMLFKRWLPSAILGGFQSKHYNPARGFLVDTNEKSDQETVYEWQARLDEGRWRTLMGVIGNYMMIARKRGYQWEDLSDLQKKNFIDAGLTLAMWTATWAVVGAAFGDDDDKDPAKLLAARVNQQILSQWNFIDWTNAATNQPAIVRVALAALDGWLQMLVATGHYVTGGEDEDIFTKRGDLKGSNAVLKYTPVTAIYYDAETFIENSDYFEE